MDETKDTTAARGRRQRKPVLGTPRRRMLEAGLGVRSRPSPSPVLLPRGLPFPPALGHRTTQPPDDDMPDTHDRFPIVAAAAGSGVSHFTRIPRGNDEERVLSSTSRERNESTLVTRIVRRRRRRYTRGRAVRKSRETRNVILPRRKYVSVPRIDGRLPFVVVVTS